MFNFHNDSPTYLLTPDLHITGKLNDLDEIAAVQSILDKYSSKILAYNVFYASKIYSIELRFVDGEAPNFKKDHLSLFTRVGTLKQIYRRKKARRGLRN
jgi:hypothetical protein